jgi:hypothetical protein
MTTNQQLFNEMCENLMPIDTAAAAQRLGKWDAIKTLSGVEAEAWRETFIELYEALPAAIEQLEKRIRVSLDQGQKSLDAKRAKREAREAAAASAGFAAGEQPIVAHEVILEQPAAENDNVVAETYAVGETADISAAN